MNEMEIQIDNGDVFIPDKIIQAGAEYGYSEIQKPSDLVKHAEMTSRIIILHYVLDGKEYKNFYKRGKWVTGVNDRPRLCVEELLEFSQ